MGTQCKTLAQAAFSRSISCKGGALLKPPRALWPTSRLGQKGVDIVRLRAGSPRPPGWRRRREAGWADPERAIKSFKSSTP
jgi:hypothetical protein